MATSLSHGLKDLPMSQTPTGLALRLSRYKIRLKFLLWDVNFEPWEIISEAACFGLAWELFTANVSPPWREQILVAGIIAAVLGMIEFLALLASNTAWRSRSLFGITLIMCATVLGGLLVPSAHLSWSSYLIFGVAAGFSYLRLCEEVAVERALKTRSEECSTRTKLSS